MARRYKFLSEEQAEHFLTHGFVVIKQALPAGFAKQQADRMWVRLGYDPDDNSTWSRDRIHMGIRDRWEVEDLAPRAWEAITDLVGGENRIKRPYTWGDSFIVNLGVLADRPWTGPSREHPGWHVDGDFFRHFLDSPEQGLLTLILWTDVRSQGGATFIAPESVGGMARFLAGHPEGLLPGEMRAGYRDVLAQCSEFVEATGQAGDVYLLHPLMLHATAPNILRDGRAITNPTIRLREPMRFDRADPDEFSLVELATLRGLGVDRYDFRPSGNRDEARPASRENRLEEQRLAKEAEEARLREAGLPLHVAAPAAAH